FIFSLLMFYFISTYVRLCFFVFFFNDTATSEIYTLSLHDALPIFDAIGAAHLAQGQQERERRFGALVLVDAIGMQPIAAAARRRDRKSTRLNSSHLVISYAVFCLKKKKKIKNIHILFTHYIIFL